MSKRNSELLTLFPTPAWWGMVDDYNNLNLSLLKYIENLRISNPQGINKSNNFGWHSQDFNLNDDIPKQFLEKAKPIIKEAIDDMHWDLSKQDSRITNMWSIINQKDSSNLRHIHPNCFLSSAYYVKAPKDCGELKFYDPRSAAIYRSASSTKAGKLNMEVYNVIPKEGLLVLFPSYLHHSVDVNNSNDERVVISFNIDLVPKALHS